MPNVNRREGEKLTFERGALSMLSLNVLGGRVMARLFNDKITMRSMS